VKENDADAWEILQPWLLDLRRRKIAVLVVHHAGRSAQMRGTSRREDSVSGSSNSNKILTIQRKDAASLSVSRRIATQHSIPTLISGPLNRPIPFREVEITYKVATFQDRVLGLIRAGIVHCTAIAKELDCTPGTVSKAFSKLEAEGQVVRDGQKYRALEACSPLDKELFERAEKVREETIKKSEAKHGKLRSKK
jgi:hypothetical protein